MKKILLILLACLPLFAIAKDNKEKNNSDPKYLAGALTYEDGKITFTREINAPGLSNQQGRRRHRRIGRRMDGILLYGPFARPHPGLLPAHGKSRRRTMSADHEPHPLLV